MECLLKFNKRKQAWLFLCVFLLLQIVSSSVLSDTLDKWAAEQWEAWILEDYPKYDCPWLMTTEKNKACIWPGKLTLVTNTTGGVFTYTVDVYERQAFIPLPGNVDHWPTLVVVNDKPGTVVERGGVPYLSVIRGSHIVTGSFKWSKRPGQLTIPNSLAIVSLEVDGKDQFVDRRNGQLIFSSKSDIAQKKANDSLAIEVYRLLQDGVPVTMTTQVVLSVSGKAREVTFGSLMLAGTEVLLIQSQIPARIEADGTMRAQVTPGEHTIQVVSRFIGSPATITTKKLTAEWPATEYLSFQSNSSIRQAKLSGAISVDTTQISIPAGWAQYPTYRMTNQANPTQDSSAKDSPTKNSLTIETEFRGDHAPAANELNLQRDLWLDFNGSGITSFDRIKGEMNKGWRLNTANGTDLGRATVDGAPILITLDEGLQGIEVRSPAIQLEAVTRTESTSSFSASGWNAQADKYSATLHLPPGWRVLHASGVDRVWGTWLSKWDLWDVFLVLIIVSVTRKLMGYKVAALSGVTYLITLHEPGTPLLIIPILLILIALLPLVSGKIKTVLRNLGFVVTASVVLIVIGFAVNTFRLAIYPSLERAQIGTYNQSRYSSAVPAATTAPILQQEMALADSAPVGKMSRSRVEQATPRPQKKKQSLYQVTENDRVQTGPGLPTWTWNSVGFRSSGPVPADQTLSIYYSTPLATSLWLVLSVFLVTFFSAIVIARLICLSEFKSVGSRTLKGAGTALSLVLIMMSSLSFSPNTMAEGSLPTLLAKGYPPEYLLEQLEARLTKAPPCLPSCVSLNDGLITVTGNDIGLQFSVYADTDIALPLPKGYGSWTLESVEEQGSVLALRQDGDSVFVALTKGHHSLELKGRILEDQASIGLPLPIHNITIASTDWVVEGLVDGRVRNDTLTLRSIDQSTTKQVDTLKADPAPVFARVKRHFVFGKKWTVETTVSRLPIDGAVSLSIKLLPDERLLSDVGVIKDGEVSVQLDHRQHKISWRSSLEASPKILLKASSGASYIEEWSFTPSSLWRLQYEGIPPVKPSANANAFEPVFKPWPGERLVIDIRKPEGVPGPIHTVENALIKVKAGNLLQRSTLTMQVRSSLGVDYTVTLPDNAEVLKFSIDGRTMNTPAGSEVIIPLQPRLQLVTIEFQSANALGLLNHSPLIRLPGSATNTRVEYSLPRDRWPLYLNGPAIGPAMLYWGVLLVIILAAIALPRLAAKLTLPIPVTTVGWLLLGIGLSTVNSYGVLIIAVMFFLLAARKELINPQAMTRFKFNTTQIGIAIWVVVALLCLVAAIPMGLLSNPEMKVVGNGSGSHFYNYYQDSASAKEGLPTVTVVSVPILAYRIVMLLWSLWLSTRLIQWAIWSWACFTEKAVWKARAEATNKDV
jgi:hypothetical protein